MTTEESENLNNEILFLQDDARYCYGVAREYADKLQPWHSRFLTPRVQEAAAHSARKARQLMGMES